MAKKIDETQLVKDFRKGIPYAEIARRQKVNTGSVAYWVKKLGLERSGQRRKKGEVFSVQEKRILRAMIETRGGRKQLLYILKGE
jgi:transposase-like protein